MDHRGQIKFYRDLLIEFGRHLNMNDLCPDDNHYCALEIDALTLHIELDLDSREILFYSQIGDTQGVDHSRLQAELLNANFLNRLTAGNTIGIDKKEGIILLSNRLHLRGLNHKIFTQYVERFVNCACVWENEISHQLSPHDHTIENPPETHMLQV